MKVKNIFSNRKNKKKKNTQGAPASEVAANNGDKLIIPSGSKDGNASGKENELSELTNCNSAENVTLRTKGKGSVKRSDCSDAELITKVRASSTSSNNSSTKAKSRRPWSFIENLKRQDSRESAYSTGSSARTSQLVEDLISPPTQNESALLPRDAASNANRNSGACTLPRSLTPEQFEQASKAVAQDNSTKRRTMDFRFFSLFKRTSSGESSAPSDALSSGSVQPNPGRSSFRGKNKGKKKASKKKRDVEGPKLIRHEEMMEDTRLRSFSDGCETSHTLTYDDVTQVPPPGLYDSEPRLNSVDEGPENQARKIEDRRVPVNGEPAFYLGDDVTDSRPSSSVTITSKGSRKYLRRSDPTNNSHAPLKCQNSTSGVSAVRSTSDSTDSSSRRSSFVCEPTTSPLPEDSIASFDSSAYLGARSKNLYSGGSVPQLPVKIHNQKIQRALSNDIPKESPSISVQARCSQSVSNLASGSDSNSQCLPRSSSDADNKPKTGRRLPQPSPHQQKQEEQNGILRAEGASVSADYIAPPSPVLRAIGYPGVVLRRNKRKPNKPRPNSAYADQRSQLVMSLNMEDLPTYSQMRREMTKSGANAFPSYEDILAVREPGTTSKRGSSGVQFASTASGRARRKGATLSNYGQRASAGFANTASVEDLGSLSSSYGSKQSLSDLAPMDEDEILNAFLAKSHAITHTSSGNLRSHEPREPKRAKAIRKSVVSLANLISPGKPNQKSKLQRSSSFKESGSASTSNTASVYSFKPYRPPSNTPNKSKNNRRSKLWCETFDHTGLNEKEIKWQEAIFELYQGERDLVQDLTMAKQTYRDSMVTLKMLSDEEVALIFGKLGCLLPLHEDLLAKLERARGEDGRTLGVGYIFVEWFPRISTAYRDYCSNQSDAKYALDAAVERDARVRDFLQRCLESPFSRKLDLWSYLDLPRTRLVKYPLLLQNVLKRTPAELGEERSHLNKVMEIIGDIIERVDETTGEQQCRYIRSKLEYLDEKHRSPCVDNSRLMLCSGQLKNNRGTKMHVFLFEEAFVLTRQTTRSNKISYQVYRHPLPLRSLVVDINEGDKLSGSFRGGILGSEKVKHSFRVRSEELNVSYTLQASEEHDKKQWINALQDALTKYKAKHPEAADNHAQLARRRATYDPSSKKQNVRSVLRSSSDKSNRSLASSTDKSSLQEEFQEDDASSASEDVGPWRRTRSQTVNPSILTSKSASSVSRKSSGSSTKSDKSIDDKGKRKDVDAEKLRNRLKDLEADGEPSPLRNSFRKKSSISRHFSLSGADRKPKVVARTKSDEEEKARNKCHRSRSLTSSPQTVKSVVARFSGKRLSHGKIGASSLAAPNAAKPPIGPNASPHSVRRTPSLKTPGTIHEAQSTPNLTVLRSTSFCTRRSSFTRLAQLAAHNSSNSVGNLRKGLAGGSAYDLRSSSAERRAEEAKVMRRSRSKDKASSEGDAQEVLPSPDTPIEHPPDGEKELPGSKPLANRLAAVAIVCTPASPKDTPTHLIRSGGAEETLDEVLTVTSHIEDDQTHENMEIDSATASSCNDVTRSDEVKSQEFQVENTNLTTSQNHEMANAEICDAPEDVGNQSADDVMAEYYDLTPDKDELPAQNSEGDLISFVADKQDAEPENGSDCAEDANEGETGEVKEILSVDEPEPEVRANIEEVADNCDCDQDGPPDETVSTESVKMDVEESSSPPVAEEDSKEKEVAENRLSSSEQDQSTTVASDEETPMETAEGSEQKDEVAESCTMDSDEGIGREDTAFEDTSSDIDNNNVRLSDKSLPDSEADDGDAEPPNCCRGEIAGDHENQQPSLQAST